MLRIIGKLQFGEFRGVSQSQTHSSFIEPKHDDVERGCMRSISGTCVM